MDKVNICCQAWMKLQKKKNQGSGGDQNVAKRPVNTGLTFIRGGQRHNSYVCFSVSAGCVSRQMFANGLAITT